MSGLYKSEFHINDSSNLYLTAGDRLPETFYQAHAHCEAMAVATRTLHIPTSKELDIVDLTGHVRSAVKESGIKSGIVTVFIPGSTASVTTTEFEPGVFSDLPNALENIAPKEAQYAHHLTWGDDNGRSHVRASILGSSLTVPFSNSSLLLGTWQQIVLVELDTRSRKRTVIVQIIGE